jgi:hypothetical protein
MSAPAQPASVGFDDGAAVERGALVRLPAPESTPRKRPKRRRGHVEQFRTDDAEHAVLAERARDAGLTVGAYLRASALGDAGPRARRRLPVDREALAHAVAEFNRAGGNLNQIARALNEIAAREEGRGRLAELVAELTLPIRALRDDFAVPLAAILAALGHDRQG